MRVGPPGKGEEVRLDREVRQVDRLAQVDEELARRIYEVLVNKDHKLHRRMMGTVSQHTLTFHGKLVKFHGGEGPLSEAEIERTIKRFFKGRKRLIEALRLIAGG